MKPVVYIASPYTKGDPAINTRSQMQAFDELMNDGVVWPVVPLWSHFQHIAFPRHYQDWIDYDLALIERYDACLRLNSEYPPLSYRVTESSGADGEVKRFESLGKPVFYDKESLYEWAGNRGHRHKLIAFMGVAGSGKDTAAQALIDLGWERVAFADAVREALLALDPYLMHDPDMPDFSVRVSSQVAYSGWERSKNSPEVRRLLQRMGTEAGRNIHGPDCWTNIARRKIEAAGGPVVITDCRFANEAAMVRGMGGRVIRIDRPGVGPKNDHASERLEFDPDFTIQNDGTIAELHEKVLELAEVKEAVA